MKVKKGGGRERALEAEGGAGGEPLDQQKASVATMVGTWGGEGVN